MLSVACRASCQLQRPTFRQTRRNLIPWKPEWGPQRHFRLAHRPETPSPLVPQPSANTESRRPVKRSVILINFSLLYCVGCDVLLVCRLPAIPTL
ncbi:hypothetical protein BR93DRAFT_44177 [Coniochaeta sp. PMI_546]|nr:hypothetical protein BR93DRAFT_44177 [Coniochaeta sp. PMI_546]